MVLTPTSSVCSIRGNGQTQALAHGEKEFMRTKKVVVRARGGYDSYRHVLEGSGDRVVMVEGRNGELKKARRYHLPETKLKAKLKEWRETGVFPSPFTKSILGDMVTALAQLGANQCHPLFMVKARMKDIMSQPHPNRWKTRVRNGITDWERFVNKDKKTENGKDVRGRLLWAAMSLRRFAHEGSSNPVGEKLRQMGACVDVFRVGPERNVEECRVYLRLNTHSVNPLKDFLESEAQIPPVNFDAPTMGPEAEGERERPVVSVMGEAESA